MTLVSSHPLPAFNAIFFRQSSGSVSVTGAATQAPSAETAGTTTRRVSYCAEVHGCHADFQRSEDFPKYKDQVLANLSALSEFCRQHEMPDAADIERNFRAFSHHRFGWNHYFDTRIELIDSIGKQSLDEFCAMIGDEAIDLETRKTAIRNLAPGMTLDADSVVSELASAVGTLTKTTGGLRGKLWNLKEATVEQILQETCSGRFQHPHEDTSFIRTAWNLLAYQVGLKKHSHVNERRLNEVESALMQECRRKVAAALTPDRLSIQLAEECQAQFNSEVSTALAQSSGILNANTMDIARQRVSKIGEGLGLVTEDSHRYDIQKKDWVLTQSDLRLSSFLKLQEDASNSITAYPAGSLHTDPSLIALDILRTMSDMKLLAEHRYPQSQGEWIDKDGRAAAIFTYGDLAFAARVAPPLPRASGWDTDTFRKPVWDTHNVEFSLITLPDVWQWKTAEKNAGQLLPPAALRQAIRATDTAHCEAMRAHWLKDTEDLWQLLQGAGTNEATDCLVRSLTYLGRGYSKEERKDLLTRIAHMGLHEAVATLAKQWPTDAPSHTGTV